jgi:hypothetical protein
VSCKSSGWKKTICTDLFPSIEPFRERDPDYKGRVGVTIVVVVLTHCSSILADSQLIWRMNTLS